MASSSESFDSHPTFVPGQPFVPRNPGGFGTGGFREFVPSMPPPSMSQSGLPMQPPFREFVPSTMAPPAPIDVRTQLRNQIEWYFGKNLATDYYLNGCMNADNFVSIHTLAAFRRVKNLTQDLATVVEVMNSIPTLEVNTELMLVRPRRMPESREVRVKVEGQMLPPITFFLDAPQNLESVYSEPYGQDMHVILVFKTERDAAVGLSAIRSKAATENRPVAALIRTPDAFFRRPQTDFNPQYGMYPPAMYFDQTQMPYGVPPYMFPSYNPQFRHGPPPQDRRNRARSAAGSAVSVSGFRRDDAAPPAPLPPRHVTEGSVPLAELPRREFVPRRAENGPAGPIVPNARRGPASGDRERTGGDRERTGGDRERTGGDRERTGGDRERTGGDRERTGGDRERTGGDRERSGGDRERRTRRHDGHHHQQPTVAAEPPREPAPALGAELFPPLAVPVRPAAPVVKAVASALSPGSVPASSQPVEEVAAAVVSLDLAKKEPASAPSENPEVNARSPPGGSDRPSFAEMLKRKQSAEAVKRAEEASSA